MFNYQKALDSGASEDDIIQYLTKTRKFNVQAALEAGANKKQIIEYLSETKPLEAKKQGNKSTAEKIIDSKPAQFLNKAGQVFGKASDFVFGATNKAVGSLISQGVGSTMQVFGNEKQQQTGRKLVEQTEGNITLGNTAFTALELYPGGGMVAKYLKKIPGGDKIASKIAGMSESLRASAIKTYSEALGATTKKLKDQTAKVVPELLKRGVKTPSLESLASKSGQLVKEAGENISQFIDNLPKDTKTQIKPVVDKLNKLREGYLVEGKIVNEAGVKAVDNITEMLGQFGDEVSTESIVKIRRILDEGVAKVGGFTADKALTFSKEAEKEAANAIRKILSQDFPDLAKLNAEYSLWKNVQEISEATIKRRSTQTGGLGRLIATVGGAGSGFASGDTMGDRVQSAIIYGIIGRKGIEFFRSPAWKTVSAIQKNKLADYLASGRLQDFGFYLSKIMTGLRNTIDQEK